MFFCDSDGILRASSRIINSLETYDVCYPIILPKRHPFVNLLIMHYHREALHMGWSQVLANMRKNFWVIRGQSTVRHYIKTCMKCKLRAAKSSEQIMAPLPRDRLLQGGRVFEVTGCDFFGPYFVSKYRCNTKFWGCIFVCFATRAVHLEVCEKMTTALILSF